MRRTTYRVASAAICLGLALGCAGQPAHAAPARATLGDSASISGIIL